MSTPKDKAPTPVEQAIERAMARIGCPPGDNSDADLYHELSAALASLKSVDDDRAKLIAERDELVEKAKEAEEYLVMALGSDAFVRTPDPIQRWILKARALLSKYKTE